MIWKNRLRSIATAWVGVRGGYLHSINAFKLLTNQSSEEVVHLVMSDALKQ
jgi:hypothetical protein